MLDRITPVLLTFNESANIGRTLSMLKWASDIVIVDSFSTDDTVAIARECAAVRVYSRAFDCHAAQWNHAIHETAIRTDWVLALDADYVVPAALIAELEKLTPSPDTAGFETHFRYCVFGKALRGSVYPPVTTLYRREAAGYVQDGHTQRVRVSGRVQRLCEPILHDDRKPLAQWCAAQSRYMALEAVKLSSTPARELRFVDRLRRKIVIAPFLMFFYCAIVKGNILDGTPGLYYIYQRTVAEFMLALHLLHLRLALDSTRQER